MLEGINDAWNSLWRLFSFNTFNGEQNVFNNFAKILKGIRTGIVYASSEVCKQVFEGGAEVVKSLRDEFTRLFTSTPSSSDATTAANSLKTSSGRSGLTSNSSNFSKSFASVKGGANISKSKGSSNDLSEQMRKHRYMQQMQSQKTKASSLNNEY